MKKWLFLLSILLPVTSFAKEQIKVAVIDTGLDLTDKRFSSHLCKSGHKDFTEEGLNDIDGHGTHVVGLIMKHAKESNYCIVIFKYFSLNRPDTNSTNYARAVAEVKNQNISLVNISGGGPGTNSYEFNVIKTSPKILFFVSAGNENKNIDVLENRYYPASYGLDNIRVIGNLTNQKVRAYLSNWGSVVKQWEIGENVLSFAPRGKTKIMSGTSMSTAIATGKFIYEHYR